MPFQKIQPAAAVGIRTIELTIGHNGEQMSVLYKVEVMRSDNTILPVQGQLIQAMTEDELKPLVDFMDLIRSKMQKEFLGI